MATDSDQYLQTDQVRANITGRTVRGGAMSMIAQILKHVLRLASVIVMARLLTPDDYGLVAMVTAITHFVAMFKDLGLSYVTIQRKDITHEQVNALFWINVILSLALMVVCAALGPLLAWFYNKPVLLWITVAMSVGYIFGGVSAQHQALLRRQMRFARLAAIEVTALAVGVAVGITAALSGAHYWALVLVSLSIGLVSAAGCWLACGWRPSWPSRTIDGLRSMLSFGGHLTAFDVMNYFSRNIDKVLVGRFYASATLGIYGKALTLMSMPLRALNAPMRAVAIPALSRLHDSPKMFRQFYLRGVWLLAFLTMPAVALCVVLAEPLVLLLLGEQWRAVAPVFAVLGAFAILLPVWNTMSWLYISTEQAKRMFKWGIIDSSCVLVSIAVGLPFGILGLACAFSFVRVVLFVPCLAFAAKNTPVSCGHILRAIAPPLLASLVAGGLVYVSLLTWATSMTAVQWVALLAAYAVAYLALVCVFSGTAEPLRRFTRVVAMLADSLRSRRPVPAETSSAV